MTRLAVLLLSAAAVAAWLGLVLPARAERDRARVEYARARQEREVLRAQVRVLERQTRRPVAAADSAAAGRALRLTLLQAIEGLPVRAVRIAAAGEQGRLLARGTLSAEGAMAALLHVTDRLVDPAAGVRVQQVSLAPRGEQADGMRLDLAVDRTEAGW